MSVLAGGDGAPRCWWSVGDAVYQRYHDREWGRPVNDDRALFEKLCLEGFQAGLSWLTILRKRDRFRAAFAGFDLARVASFDDADVERLMGDAGIVRNRAKIEASIANARAARALVEQEAPLAEFVWGFAPPPRRAPHDRADLPSATPESVALAGALKRRGFRFVGPTTAYAFMQSVGLVNDHLAGCVTRAEVAAEQAATRAILGLA